MVAVVAAVLAHQGGWDEALLVLAPVLVFAYLLRVANRRAQQFAAREDDDLDHAAADDRAGDDRPR